jgi:hypothetical protein
VGDFGLPFFYIKHKFLTSTNTTSNKELTIGAITTMEKKWRNRSPFIILLIIHASLLFYTFFKKKDRKGLVVLLFSNIGMGYLFEYFVLNLFNAYKYKPKIFRDRYLDNIFGAILSQAIYVPFTAVFISGLGLGHVWKIVFTIYFTFMDFLFVKLKVYRHYWWKTSYSFIGIIFFFNLSDWWYERLKNSNKKIQFLSLFLFTLSSGVNILYILAIIKPFRFGYQGNYSWKTHFRILPLYSLCRTLYIAFVACKGGLAPKVSYFLLSFMTDAIIKRSKIVRGKFNLKSNLSFHLLMMVVGSYVKHLIYGEKEH